VPRVLAEVCEVSTATSVLGTPVAAPLGVAPTSLQRAADPRGEVAMAAACAGSGLPMVVSSNATATFADIADIAATGVHWWLRASLPQDRERARPMLDAAVGRGCARDRAHGGHPRGRHQVRRRGEHLGRDPRRVAQGQARPGR
jgi:4-hydroxymandelate oxidase